MNPIVAPMPRSPSPIPPSPLPDVELYHNGQIHPTASGSHSRSPPPSQQLPDHDPDPDPESEKPNVPHFLRSNAIPWRQLIPIQMFRIADASAYTVIFPFVAALITSFDTPRDKIGLYTGLAEGVMMLMEAAAAPFWAKAADKWGRRACMNWGYGISILPALMFGFCRSSWELIFWRTLFGTINPIGVIGKILASEICHPGNRAKVFAIFSPGFAVGSMMGTLIGGEFSHPWHRLPAWLGGRSEFYRDWPFALPCVVLAVFGVFCTMYGFAALEETRPPVKKVEGQRTDLEKARPKISYSAAWKVPGFALITAIFCFFQFTVLSWDGIASVWLYTPLDRGGLAMEVDIIGLLMAFNNLLYIFLSPYALPRLQKKYGAVRTLRICCMIYPAIALLMPVMSISARHSRPFMWFNLFIYMSLKCVAGMAWPLCDMLTTGAFDDYPHLLATGSAVSLIAGAFGRAIGPGVAGWIYSISTEFHAGTLGRQLPWLVILATSFPALILSRVLPADEGEKGTKGRGYETVPMVDTARHSEDDDHDDEEEGREDEAGFSAVKVKVSGINV